MRSFLDVEYKENLFIDLHLPESENFDLFIYFHGGGLEAGDRKGTEVFAKDLTIHARNLLVVKNSQDVKNLIALSNESLELLKAQAEKIPNDDLMEYMKIFSVIESEMKYALSPKTLLETAVITAISEVGDQKKNVLN